MNQTECRRKVAAEHFGHDIPSGKLVNAARLFDTLRSTPKPSVPCDMCDICVPAKVQNQMTLYNCIEQARIFLGLLEEFEEQDHGRITIRNAVKILRGLRDRKVGLADCTSECP